MSFIQPIPMASRTHWIDRSRAFLGVALRYRPLIRPARFRAGIAFWCRGFPIWYRRWLLESLGMQDVSLRPSDTNIVPQLASAFGKGLVARHQTTIFLLGDADILAHAYEAQGGQAILCRLSRSTLPSPIYCYLDLFDLVNRVVEDNSTTDYSSFYRSYRTTFDDYASQRPKTRAFLERIATPLALSNATAIADVGMQGTLAFALCATLERLTGSASTVHLAVSYPWLSHVMKGTTQTDAAGAALAIEQASIRNRQRCMSDMDDRRWTPIRENEYRA